MTTQINRKYKLNIGDYRTGDAIEIEGLQISFDVSKSSDNSKNTNSASIEIYNLSDDHLKLLQTEYPAAIFQVGYGEATKLLFGGQVTNLTTRKSGTDRVTQLLMGSGYTELNHSTISKIVPAGKTVKEVAEEIAKTFPNVSRGVYNGTNLNNVVTKGYPLSGTLKESLDKLSDTYNLEWRLDADGKDGSTILYVNDRDRAQDENFAQAYIISPESGLIEIPYYTSGDIKRSKDDKVKKHGVQFTMFLNPDVYPGEIIKLEDTEITGWFKVDAVRYSGSWRNGNWIQDVRCSVIEKVNKDG